MIDLKPYPAIARIVDTLVASWPDHARFLDRSFAPREPVLMRSTEAWAKRILNVVEHSGTSLAQYCADYQFLCGKVLEEEMHFRRSGGYRLSKFEDAVREVYSNREFMGRYMNFLLLSHVLWENHARAMFHFENDYLPRLPDRARHLEIGPGHGLLLYCAAESPKVADLYGWDVSATSIEQTERCMKALGQSRPVHLVLQDLFEAPGGEAPFDSVVLAEVLEHLEDPVAALQGVARHMAPRGLLWVHVPINSPAPDHLYLLRSPEEVTDLMARGGFEVVDAAFYPMSGSTLQKARKLDLTISAVVTARKSG